MPKNNTQGRKSNVKNSLAIKTKKISTPWLKNAIKSIGASSMEVFKDISPNIYDVTTSSTKSVNELAKMVRTGAKSTSITNALKNNRYVKGVQDVIQYSIEDIKSGKLNNEDRLNEKTMQSFMGEGWDDFDPDAMFSDWNMEDDQSTTNVQFNNFSSGYDGGMTVAIDEGFRSSTEANLKGHKANIDAMVAISSAQMLQQQELNNQIISHLSNISNTMASIAEFNNSTMTTFIESATAFMEAMGKKEDDDYAYSSDKIDPSSVYRGRNGGINADNYSKYVMQNIKSTFRNSSVGLLDGLLADNMDILISNPMGAITKLAISQITPKTLKKSMEQLDEAVAEFIPTILARIADEGDGFSFGFKDGVVKTLAKVFGVKMKRTKEFDMENKITDKAATYDQITRHSIVEVIPKHLREQSAYLKAIADRLGVDTREAENNSKVFNYQTGRYRKLKDIKEDIYSDIRGSVTYKMGSSKFGNKLQEFMPTGNQKDTDTYTSMLDDLYVELERYGKFINPKELSKDSRMSKIIDKLDYSDNSKNYLKAALKQTFSDPDMALNINAMIQQAITARNNTIKQMTDDPTAYNLWALDLDKTVDGGMNEFYSKNKSKNIVSKSSGSKSSGGVLDVLTDIKFLLNRGINVRVVGKTPFEDLDKTRNREARIAERAAEKQQRAIDKSIKRRQRKLKRKGELDEQENQASIFDGKEKSPDQWEEFMNGESFSFYRENDEPEHEVVTRIKNAMQALAFGNGAEMFAQLTMILGDKVSKLGKMLNEQFWTPMKQSIFGQKDNDGYSRDGILSGFQNKFLDTYKKFSREFTGKGYTDSAGNKIEDKKEGEESVVGNLKKFAREVKNDVGDFILGERLYDENTGEYIGRNKKNANWIGKAINSLEEGFHGWKTAFFGEDDERDTKTTLADIRDKISDALPAIGTGTVGGAVFGALSGGSLLGTLIGGPIGGAVMGGIGGILSRSEKFKKWLFGDEDEDNGIISKKVQNFFKENKVPIIGGAVLGTAKSMLFGGGLLGSIVGGPIAGALAGSAVALAKRSNLFQTFLYGDEDKGGWHKGVVNMFNNIFKKGDGSGEASGGKLLGMAGIGALGGAMTAGIVGKMGLIGAALTPFGPVGGALAGLALSIKASNKGFHSWLFGEEYVDENGNKAKKAGILQKFANMLNVELFEPMKFGLMNFADDAKNFVIDKIMAPVEFAIEPFAQGLKNMVDGIKNKIDTFLSNTGDFIKKHAIDPIVETVRDYIVKPIRGIFGFLFKGITGIAKTIIASPFQGLALATNFMDARNKKSSREQVMKENRGRGLRGFVDNMKIRFNYGDARDNANYAHLGYDDRTDRKARYEQDREKRLQEAKDAKERRKNLNYNHRLMAKVTGNTLTLDTEENRRIAQEMYSAQHPYKLYGRKLKFKGDAIDTVKPVTNNEVLKDADNPKSSTENRILGQNLKIVKLLTGISNVLHGKGKANNQTPTTEDSEDSTTLMDVIRDIPSELTNGENTYDSIDNLADEVMNRIIRRPIKSKFGKLFGIGKDNEEKPTETENTIDAAEENVKNLPKFAEGGVSPGGDIIVGEEGPEVARLPKGTNIISNMKPIKVVISDLMGSAKNFFTRQTEDITDAVDDVQQPSVNEGSKEKNSIIGFDITHKNREAYNEYKKKGSYTEQEKERKAKSKEEKEEAYRNHLISSLDSLKENNFDFKKMWASIFSKKGLITGALLLALPLLLKFLKNGFPAFLDNMGQFISSTVGQFMHDAEYGKKNLTGNKTPDQRFDANVKDFKDLLKTGNLMDWIMPNGEIDSMSGAKGNIVSQLAWRTARKGLRTLDRLHPIQGAKNVIGAIGDLGSVAGDVVKGTFNLGKDVTKGLFGFLGDTAKAGAKGVKNNVIDSIKEIGSGVKKGFGGIKTFFGKTKKGAVNAFDKLDDSTKWMSNLIEAYQTGGKKQGVSNFLDMANDMKAMDGVNGKGWDAASELFGFDNDKGLIKKGIDKAKTGIKNTGKNIVDKTVEGFHTATGKLSGLIDDVGTKLTGIFDNMMGKVTGVADNVMTFLKQGASTIGGVIGQITEPIVSKLSKFADDAATKIGNGLDFLKNAGGGLLDNIKNPLQKGLEKAKGFAGDVIGKAGGISDNVMTAVGTGAHKISSMADNAIGAVKNSNVGKLGTYAMDVTGEAIDNTKRAIGGKIGRMTGKVSGAVDNVVSGAASMADDAMKSGIKGNVAKLGGVADDVAKAGAKAGGTLVSAVTKMFDNVVSVITKFGGKANALTQFLGKVVSVLKNSGGRVATRLGSMAKGIGSGIAKAGKALSTVIAPVTFTLGAINGASGAKRLFRTDNVDGWMVAISTAIGAFNQSLIGGILDMANELVTDIMGLDLYHEVACIAYHAIAGEQKYEELISGKMDFEGKYDTYKKGKMDAAYNEYLAQNGLSADQFSMEEFEAKVQAGEVEVDVESFATWNDQQHQTLGSKAMQAVGKAWDKTKGVREKIGSTVKQVGGKVIGGAKKAFNVAKEVGGKAKEFVVDTYEKGVEKAKTILENIGNMIKPFTDTILNIGKKIFGEGDDGSSFMDRTMAAGKSLLSNFGELGNIMLTGDVKGALAFDPKVEEGTPLTPLINILSFIGKIVAVPVSAVTWIGGKLFEKINTVVSPMNQDVSQSDSSVGELVKNALKGNFEGISRFQPKTSDTPIGGALRAIMLGGKFIAYPVALVSKVGQAIAKAIGGAVKGVVSFVGPAISNLAGIVTKSVAGDLEGITSFEIDVPEGTPLGGILKAILHVVKFVGYPIAMISKIGQNIAGNIYEFVKSSGQIFSVVGANASKYFTMAKDGSIMDAIAEPVDVPEGTPLGGFSTFLTHVAKIFAIPVGGIAKIGGAIGDFIGGIIKTAKTTFGDVVKNSAAMNKLVLEGKPGEIMSYKTEKTEGNPLGWFVSVGTNIAKPFYAIAAGVSAIGKPIIEFLGKLFKPVKDFGGQVLSFIKSANEFSDPDKDMSGFDKLTFGSADSTDPATKIVGSVLKTVMKVWVNINRGIRSVTDKLFGFIKDAGKWVGEKVDDIVKSAEDVGKDMPKTSSSGGNGGRGGRSIRRGGKGGYGGGFGKEIDLPYFSQNDPRWKSTPYGNETMGEAGCGPDAMAMVVGGLQDRTMNPVKMANYAKQKGYRDSTGTNWNFVDSASKDYNLKTNKQIKPNAGFIQNELKQGRPVMLSGQSSANGKASPFTAEGHYVVATGVDDNGNVEIQDPRGTHVSGNYNLEDVASNTNMGWSFANKGGRGRRVRHGGRGFRVINGGRGLDDVVLGKVKSNSTKTVSSKSNDPDMLNNFPFLLQGDGRWGSHPYTSRGDASQTIASSGCGTTSMAMVLRSYGNNVSPIDTADWSRAHGFRTANSGTSWGFFPAISREYGLTCTELGKNGSAISQALDNGYPVIASMGPGVFTNGGHFIVLCGKDTNGNIVVNDPASKDRSQKSWPLSIFLSQGKNFWSFNKNGKGSIGALIDAGTLNLPSSGSTQTEVKTTKDGAPMGPLEIVTSFFSQFAEKAWNGILTGKWDSNYTWDNTGSSSTSNGNTISTGEATPITGSDNAEKTWNFMGKQGLTKAGRAGLLGNIEAESGINPKNLQNTYEKSLGMSDEQYTNAVDSGSYSNFVHDKAGYGIVQWTYHSLKQQLLDYKKKTGKSIGDLGMQLELLTQQLQTSYPSVWNTLKTTNDVQEASNKVLLEFEKPKDQSAKVQQTRGNFARGYYEKYKNLADGGSTATEDKSTTENNNEVETKGTDKTITHDSTSGKGGRGGEVNGSGNSVAGRSVKFAEYTDTKKRDDKSNIIRGLFTGHEKIDPIKMNKTVNGGRGGNDSLIINLLQGITGFLEKISDSTMSSDQKLNMLKNIQSASSQVNVINTGGKGESKTTLQPIIIGGNNEQIVTNTDRNTEIAQKLAKGF